MITRRLLGFVSGFALMFGIATPGSAACSGTAGHAGAAHSDHHAAQPNHERPSHDPSQSKVPCSSHDSDCCTMMTACGSMAMPSTIHIASAPALPLESSRMVIFRAPPTPTLSVEPPPPRA